jgi:cobalt-zinc-cadmium efflux system protein
MHSQPHDHHDHGHPHHAGHDLGRRRLALVLGVTAAFLVVEFVGGLLANSLALLADAGHMLGDVGALGLSLFALWFARRPATPEKSYGYYRIEILAALANGLTLSVIAIAIFAQAWSRLRSPEPVEGPLMLGVATAGLLVNLFAAAALHATKGHNLNIRGAYLHVLGDLLGSVGAILAALLILLTGWTPADPLISCAVGVLILVGSWRLVRESVDVLLEAVPRDIDLDAVRLAVLSVPGVDAVHDLHVWTLTSGFRAMSGHALINDPRNHNDIIQAIHARMHENFGISHVTVQVEYRAMVRIRERVEHGSPD